MKPPPLDRRVVMRIGVHVGKDGEPSLSITNPGSTVTRIVRRKPKKPPAPKQG